METEDRKALVLCERRAVGEDFGLAAVLWEAGVCSVWEFADSRLAKPLKTE